MNEIGYVGAGNVFYDLTEWKRFCDRHQLDPNQNITHDAETVRQVAWVAWNECEQVYELLQLTMEQQRKKLDVLRADVERLQKERPNNIMTKVNLQVAQEEYERQAYKLSGMIDAYQLIGDRCLKLCRIAKMKG